MRIIHKIFYKQVICTECRDINEVGRGQHLCPSCLSLNTMAIKENRPVAQKVPVIQYSTIHKRKSYATDVV